MIPSVRYSPISSFYVFVYNEEKVALVVFFSLYPALGIQLYDESILLQTAPSKKEAEKREAWKKKGHGEFREVTEGDFLGEVTGSEKIICHFYHKEIYQCKE
ncbi:thioredoxin domain-containing protein PLP3B-like [Vicia villosa]|uniref:thioredoxin domain-containing protein PLP3B-like n=1 Tax=Vicia villosa TaxID=3911 RepID=UPI00273C1A91|nr:thioredoxin domain-containing protein PLP3B-like [Vicia villosa]